jgi:hypothetical protein
MTARPDSKPRDELGPDDFASHPVWIDSGWMDRDEPWFDPDECEGTVRPWTSHLPAPAGEESFLLVRAAFTLADGTRLSGYVTPQPRGQEPCLGFVQPRLFAPSGQPLQVWFGLHDLTFEETRAEFYAALGKGPAEVFPARFEIEEGLTTGQLTGTIRGLGRMTKDQDAIIAP